MEPVTCDQIFHAPGARLWHYAAELHAFSVTYPFCGLALTNIMDNCLLYVFVPLIIHNQGLLIPPIAFTSCRDQGSKPATPRWEGQRSNHAANLNCIIGIYVSIKKSGISVRLQSLHMSTYTKER